jgi:hypothetical protein
MAGITNESASFLSLPKITIQTDKTPCVFELASRLHHLFFLIAPGGKGTRFIKVREASFIGIVNIRNVD